MNLDIPKILYLPQLTWNKKYRYKKNRIKICSKCGGKYELIVRGVNEEGIKFSSPQVIDPEICKKSSNKS